MRDNRVAYGKPISRSIPRPGSTPSRSIIAATIYSSFRQTVRAFATLQLNGSEGFDLRTVGHNSPETLHTMIEAKKIAWADRAKFYADPAFAKVPLAGLLSKGYAAERQEIDLPGSRNQTGRSRKPGA